MPLLKPAVVRHTESQAAAWREKPGRAGQNTSLQGCTSAAPQCLLQKNNIMLSVTLLYQAQINGLSFYILHPSKIVGYSKQLHCTMETSSWQ